jgi:hypothetical protein
MGDSLHEINAIKQAVSNDCRLREAVDNIDAHIFQSVLRETAS